jgi:4-hydroxybenzoate polyprenyltransferase
MVGVVTWLLGFDTLYSLQDEAFDRQAGLRSIPARFGARRAMAISEASHVATVACFASCGLALHRGPFFAGAVVLSAALLAYEHALVRRRGLAVIHKAFFYVNAWVSCAFFGLVLFDELFRRYAR